MTGSSTVAIDERPRLHTVSSCAATKESPSVQTVTQVDVKLALGETYHAGIYPRHLLLYLRRDEKETSTISTDDTSPISTVVMTATTPPRVQSPTSPDGKGALRTLSFDAKDHSGMPCRMGHNNPWRQFVKRIAASSSEEAVKMHKEMLDAGVEADVYSFSAVMTACQRQNDCEQVIRCFREMKARNLEPDLLAYNTVIMAYANKGVSECVFDVFNEMKAAGVSPDARTYTYVIAACSKIEGGQVLAESIFEELKSNGIAATKSTYKSMMTLFGVPSPKSHNGINGNHGTSSEPLPQRRSEGNNCNYQHLLDDGSRTSVRHHDGNVGPSPPNRMRAATSHELHSTTHNDSRKSMGNTGEDGVKGTTCSVSPSVTRPRASSFQKGDTRNPRLLLQEMRERGMHPDVKTYNAALFTCARVVQLVLAEEIFNDMKAAGVQPDMQSYNAMISACAKVSALDRAEMYFDEMTERNFRPETITYNGLISAAGRSKDCEKAEKFFQRMKEDGLVPDCASFNALLAAVAKHSLERSEELLHEMLSRKIHLTLISYTTLISAASKSNTPERAEDFFRMMRHDGLRPNAVTFTSMISAAVRYSRQRAFSLFKEMLEMGLEPTNKIYKTLIETCAEAYNHKLNMNNLHNYHKPSGEDPWMEEIARNAEFVIRHMQKSNVELERHTKVARVEAFSRQWNVAQLQSPESPAAFTPNYSNGPFYSHGHVQTSVHYGTEGSTDGHNRMTQKGHGNTDFRKSKKYQRHEGWYAKKA